MIEVRIPKSAIVAYGRGSEVHEGVYVLGRLRAAGIPIQGNLFPTVPSSGALSVEVDDLALEEWVYRWSAP